MVSFSILYLSKQPHRDAYVLLQNFLLSFISAGCKAVFTLPLAFIPHHPTAHTSLPGGSSCPHSHTSPPAFSPSVRLLRSLLQHRVIILFQLYFRFMNECGREGKKKHQPKTAVCPLAAWPHAPTSCGSGLHRIQYHTIFFCLHCHTHSPYPKPLRLHSPDHHPKISSLIMMCSLTR